MKVNVPRLIGHPLLSSVPEAPRGQRMPIDTFLRSLAEDRGDNAIGIILSSTGADGTLGLRALLGAGGATPVQEPASAKYDGMSVSAIQADDATYVLAPDKMPETAAGCRAPPYRTRRAFRPSRRQHPVEGGPD